jgi:hypothetical protein
MWEFSVSRAFSLLAETMPFVFLRLAVYFGGALAYLVAIGLGASVGYGVGHISDSPEAFGFWGGVIGFAGVSFAVYWLREYALYMLKAGHIAVLVERMQGHPLPEGQGQIDYARSVVTQRFGEANALFVLDQLIKAVIAAITGMIGGIAAFIPLPGLEGLVRLVNLVIRVSLTYVDEIILAYNFRINASNPWESARQGLVLYAQNSKRMIRNAAWLALMMWGLTLAIFIVVLAPMTALFYIFPGDIAGWSFVGAIVFAWAFKSAVLEPFAIAALMDVFFRVTEGQVPDPEWDRALSETSEKFRDIKERALGRQAA